MERRAFEPTGLVPRSIIRTLNRFFQQLKPESEAVAVQEFRISRYQVLVSVRSLIFIFFVPLLVNIFSKAFLFQPLAQYIWNNHQNEIFLNSYQENRAFLEMQDFSERIFFESLLKEEKASEKPVLDMPRNSFFPFQPENNRKAISVQQIDFQKGDTVFTADTELQDITEKEVFELQVQFQKEALQLASYYNNQSINALANIFGESFTLATLTFLLVSMRPQIIILKSFLTESIYSLSDTTKSFLLILLTDLLVGFHSPRGWEIVLETTLKHFGIPENQDFIFLFVATFPVFLDTVFKYWIFRYLNKISPSTVATYHNMIE
jgi:hypothetical protein